MQSSYIQRWRERFLASRLSGLVARHQGRKVRPDAAKLEARILEWTRRGPRDGTTHWSSRRLAAALGTNHMTVSRVWARHGLQPHRLRRYMLSEDPDFEQKAADIIGLYLNPPDHAAVFCVDEKTAIQALDRLDPVLPLSPGRAEAHGFEYTVTALFLCTRPWIPAAEKSLARPLNAIPARSSSIFSPKW